jgi:hypothetical protein
MTKDKTNQTVTMKDVCTLPESAECLESLTNKGDAAVSKVIDGDTSEVLNKYSINPEGELQDALDHMARDIALIE